MSDRVFLGIDGGGTHLRTALCDDSLHVLAEREYGAANPSTIGRDAARALIHTAIDETAALAGIPKDAIAAAGVGIAGVAAEHSTDWLRDVMTNALPDALIVPSSDVEIALVGAHGKRHGVIVLAGTGSVAFGVNAAGESLMVGGWGYAMGDEGSGYWIGVEALKTFARCADQNYSTDAEAHTQLDQRVRQALDLATPKALLGWVYGQVKPRIADVAALAPLVLQAADEGDAYAGDILDRAAAELARLAHTAQRRLGDADLAIAFAGGLLTRTNALSTRLCRQLALDHLPLPLYPPVIGGALLARQRWIDRPTER